MSLINKGSAKLITAKEHGLACSLTHSSGCVIARIHAIQEPPQTFLWDPASIYPRTFKARKVQ